MPDHPAIQELQSALRKLVEHGDDVRYFHESMFDAPETVLRQAEACLRGWWVSMDQAKQALDLLPATCVPPIRGWVFRLRRAIVALEDAIRQTRTFREPQQFEINLTEFDAADFSEEDWRTSIDVLYDCALDLEAVALDSNAGSAEPIGTKPEEGTPQTAKWNPPARTGEKANGSYLGIILGDREVYRVVGGKTIGPVEFGDKARPWEMFKMLFEVGENGINCADVQDTFHGKQYNHKTTILTLLQPLKLNIKIKGKNWTLVALP